MTLLDHLRRRVVAQQVEPHLVHFDRLCLHVLIVPQPVQEGRDIGLHHERAVARQVCSHVLKAAHLVLLGQQVEQRVEHHIDQTVPARHRYVSQVTDRHRKPIPARLRAQLLHHRRRQVDPVDAKATRRERQRDPARADAQLQGGTRPCQSRQEGGRRILIAAPVAAVLPGHLLVETHHRLIVLHGVGCHSSCLRTRQQSQASPSPGQNACGKPVGPWMRWSNPLTQFAHCAHRIEVSHSSDNAPGESVCQIVTVWPVGEPWTDQHHRADDRSGHTRAVVEF